MSVNPSAQGRKPPPTSASVADAHPMDKPVAPSATVQTMVRLLREVHAYDPRGLVLVVVLSVGVTVTSGIGLLMLVPLLGVAGLDVGSGSIGQLAQLATRALAGLGLGLTLPTVVGAFLAVVTFGAALQRFHAVRTVRLYQGHVASVRRRVHAAITRCGWVEYVRRPSSSFVHVLTMETERLGSATSAMMNLGISTFMTLIYVGVALYLSQSTTILVMACGGVLLAVLARETRLGRTKGAVASNAYAGLQFAISEHLAGMRVSKSHGLEGFHIDRFHERAYVAQRAQVDLVRNQANVGFWLQVGSATIMAGVFVVALLVVALPLASILMMLFVFSRLVPMLSRLQRNVQQILSLLPSVDRVEHMVASLESMAEPADGDAEPLVLEEAVTFSKVQFEYDTRTAPDRDSSYRRSANEAAPFSDNGLAPPTESDHVAPLMAASGPRDNRTVVVRDLELVIPAGKTTAIVGPSGAGKSTVADLAVGLLRPTNGVVAVDGVALEGARLHAWRRQLGYVNQDTFLFNETIRENLRLVRSDATDDDIRAALHDASASFVYELPAGLDTVVGERGVRLSGGERQRIALARAILREPTLLILDEATSALDPLNEHVIQAAIERMAGRLTILIVAHRLVSIRRADVIYVMEGGLVVESGAWSDLVERPAGRFRALCAAQGLLSPSDDTDVAPDGCSTVRT